MSGAQPLLTVRALSFAYPAAPPVLRGVDFEAGSGQFVCVLGPKGSGKTTLLRCLLGLLAPASGDIRLDGRPLGRYTRRELARRMGYVAQTTAASFAFAAEDIVLMGRMAHLGALGLPGPADQAVAREAMKMTHTLPFARRTLDELSGGEAQCVMIARALAQQPMLLLLDEPTSHLDLQNQLLIYTMMQRVAHEWPMTVLCISHDVNLAARFADRLLLLHEGRVLADGTPREVIDRDLLSRAFRVGIELVPAAAGAPIVRAVSP